ncbi:MAG: diguanylate cyclase, partial [Acetobacteraceae bacterium]
MALAQRLFPPGAPLAPSDAIGGAIVAAAVWGAIWAAAAPGAGASVGAVPGLAAGTAIAASLGLRRARALGSALAAHGREAAARARQSEARYRLLADHAGDMIVLSRADRTRIYVSPACRALLGWEPEEMLHVDFGGFVHPEDRARVVSAYAAFCQTGGRTGSVYRLRHKAGHYVWVEVTQVTAPASDAAATGYDVVGVVRDISQRKTAEDQVAYLSRHDLLTGLPNREVLRERAGEALRHVDRGAAVALLSIDLDRFQVVNDQFGHASGDALLWAVAQRLVGGLHEGDAIARLDGDAFTVLATGLDRPEDAGRQAERLLAVLGAPLAVADGQVTLTASIGIAVAPADGTDFEKLLQKSETALLRCKQDARGAWRFFEPGMDARRGIVQALTLDLRKALAAEEFELFYQALVALDDRRITGFEALLRWRHPTRGLVSPAEFIPIAEDA